MLGHDLYTWVAHREWINADSNFDTLGDSALLLFRCLTADGWSGLMGDATAVELRGGCSEEAGDCGHISAIPFFISFQVRALPMCSCAADVPVRCCCARALPLLSLTLLH